MLRYTASALLISVVFIAAEASAQELPDPAELDRTLEDAREAYAGERDTLITELEDIRTATIRAMQDAKDDLGKRRGEHGSILEGRARAQRVYEQHLTYLERASNALLSIYRESNRETRKDAGPVRFKEAWCVMRPPVEVGPPPDALPHDKLEAAVVRAQASLDERMREVHAEYERAFRA